MEALQGRVFVSAMSALMHQQLPVRVSRGAAAGMVVSVALSVKPTDKLCCWPRPAAVCLACMLYTWPSSKLCHYRCDVSALLTASIRQLQVSYNTGGAAGVVAF